MQQAAMGNAHAGFGIRKPDRIQPCDNGKAIAMIEPVALAAASSSDRASAKPTRKAMATLTTHTLNSVDGTHAGSVGVSLYRVAPDGSRQVIFEAETDAGGRLSQRIAEDQVDPTAAYELVFQTGAYFAARNLSLPGLRLQKEAVIRFCMPDPAAAYHMPLVMAPNGYSVWLSS
ncbi:MAG: hydroxyisourate hydrolase [Burkholderiales bacterium]